MSEPVEQHVVPAFYLRRFAEDGHVAAYDMEREVRRIVPVRTFLRETHRNTLTGEGAPDYDLEKQLGDAEAASAPVLERLATKPLLPATIKELWVLRNFLAAQLCRGLKRPGFSGGSVLPTAGAAGR